MVTVCLAWEGAFHQASATVDRSVLLRMGIGVGGRDDPATAELAQLVRAGLGGRVGSGQQWVSWVGLDDLLSAMTLAIDDDTMSATYHVTSPNPVTNTEMMSTYRHLLGRRIGVPSPAVVAEIGAPILGSSASLVLTGRRVVPTRLLEQGFTFAQPMFEPAARAGSRSMRLPLTPALRRVHSPNRVRGLESVDLCALISWRSAPVPGNMSGCRVAATMPSTRVRAAVTRCSEHVRVVQHLSDLLLGRRQHPTPLAGLPRRRHTPCLTEAQTTYLDVGAMEARFVGNVRTPGANEPVDEGWRPIDPILDRFEADGTQDMPGPDDLTALYGGDRRSGAVQNASHNCRTSFGGPA